MFLDLEPHVKGGGQFGGFSGPDGLGVALRGLCRVLDYVGIGYHMRDFDDVRAARQKASETPAPHGIDGVGRLREAETTPGAGAGRLLEAGAA